MDRAVATAMLFVSGMHVVFQAYVVWFAMTEDIPPLVAVKLIIVALVGVYCAAVNAVAVKDLMTGRYTVAQFAAKHTVYKWGMRFAFIVNVIIMALLEWR